nr:inositol monophosphatase family protein [Alteribacter populi]
MLGYGVNVWDVAAGDLILSEAGGNISDMGGASYRLTTRDIIATNGRIHRLLVKELGHSCILD